ncbi:MAG: hypothetical protein GY716_16165 [bacterium]|nr:hypothetical protein [bacterium]
MVDFRGNPTTVNEKLLNAAIRHATHLVRLQSQVGNELSADLDDLFARILRSVERAVDGVQTRGPGVSSRSRANIRKLVERMGKFSNRRYRDIRRSLVAKMQEISSAEARFQTATFRSATPAGLSLGFTSPNPTALRAIPTRIPMALGEQSAFVQEFFPKLSSDLVRRVTGVVNSGLQNGSTSREIVEALRNPVSGTLPRSRRELTNVVRTAVNHASSQAREATYAANSDLIRSVKFVAVLDVRTTNICRSLDGEVFQINEGDRPPMHHQALLSGSLITTRRGLIPIEDVKVGDEVLTHAGRWRRVYTTMGRRAGPERAWALQTSSGRVLRATDEHPVLTSSRGWVHAEFLQPGDEVFEHGEKLLAELGLSAARPTEQRVLIDADHRPTESDEPLVPFDVTATTRGMSAAVQLQRNSLRHEGEVYNQRVDDVLERTGVAQDPEQSTLSAGRCLAPALGHGLGHTSADLRILARVGDAHSLGSRGAVLFESGGVGTTVVPVARERDALAHVLGGGSPLGPHGDAEALASTGEGGLAETQLSFECPQGPTVLPVLAENECFKVGDVHTEWYRTTIVDVSEIPNTGRVWNLAVEEDESYVADGVVVHNCRSTTVPVLVSWREFGLQDPPKAVRAALDGTVPADVTYIQWLRRQPAALQDQALGRGIGRLFRAGRITDLKQLVDPLTRRPIGLREILRMEGLAA